MGIYPIVKTMKWIYISEKPLEKNRKTKIFLVKSKDNDAFIGVIKWLGRWRKYCFFPESETVYEWVCLRDIADFCQSETKEYKRYGYIREEIK